MILCLVFNCHTTLTTQSPWFDDFVTTAKLVSVLQVLLLELYTC